MSALVEQHHVRTGRGDVLDQVGGHQHAGVATQLAQQRPERHPLLGVQSGCRLVQEQDVGVVDDRLRHPGPSDHPPGQGAHPVTGPIGQSDPGQRPFHRDRDVGSGHLLEPREVLDVLRDGEPRVEADVLRQVPQPAPHRPQPPWVGDVGAEQLQGSGRRPEHRRQRPHQRGLAGPVRAEQAVHTAAQIQVEAVDRDPAARPDGEAARGDGAAVAGGGQV